MKTKLLIFGITGDLSRRKLLPALSQIVETQAVTDIEIIGISRREVDVADLLTSAHAPSLKGIVRIITLNLARLESYRELKDQLALKDDEQLLAYLSVPPGASAQIVDFMGEVGLNTPNVKILFEKPFGVDLVSAEDFIAQISRYYDESQLYRIDHYLAKEMAQNIVTFRGGNALFSHIWNNNFIERIEIIASESIDIEGRAHFYEQTGALRDIIQGHLLQLLALTLMDIPHDFDWNELPALRLKALEQIVPADPSLAIRAQYTGYQDEVENPGSLTETFVSLQLQSTQPRWLDVPITITAGKALPEKQTEIRIHLKKLHEAQSNCITFRIQPDEGVGVELFVKKPGYEQVFDTRELGFAFTADDILPDAYEHVLVDAVRSRKSLFTTSEEVLASWRIVAPLQHAWDMGEQPLHVYKKGSQPEQV